GVAGGGGRHHPLDSGGVSGSLGVFATTAATRRGVIAAQTDRLRRDPLATIEGRDDSVPLSRPRRLRRSAAPAAGTGRVTHGGPHRQCAASPGTSAGAYARPQRQSI